MKSKIHEHLNFNNLISKKLMLLLIVVLTFNLGMAQDEESTTTPAPNYRAAAKYSPTNLGKLVHSTSVRPHWLKNGNRFWYQYKTTEGSNYYIVDADSKSKKELFDKEKMLLMVCGMLLSIPLRLVAEVVLCGASDAGFSPQARESVPLPIRSGHRHDGRDCSRYWRCPLAV